jgi:uncharacterized membrane protein
MLNKTLILSGLVFLTIDFMYLSLIKTHFAKQIKIIQGSQMEINYIGAIICYIFLIFGLNYFIINRGASVLDAFLLGLVIYATFDFTNMALFKKWSLITSIIDTLWGGILFASSTYIIKKLV